MEEQWTYKTDDQIHPPREIQSSAAYPEGVDWDDDSGAIHTVKQTYKITKEDGWQDNRGYHRNMMSPEQRRTKPQKIKGTQVGIHYETVAYRVVVPLLFIFGIIMTAVCVIVTMKIPLFGIFFDVMWALTIIGIIRQRYDKKWRNQAKRRKEAKENDIYRN